MIHFNISIWRKGCVNENKLEFIVKERKLGSNESWNTRRMQHGGPVGSEKQIEGTCTPMTFCNHFFSLGLQTYTSFFLVFVLKDSVLPNLDQNLSVVAALNRSPHIGFTSEETSTKG